MNPMPLIRKALPLLALWILFSSVIEASVTSRLSTRFLARGERAMLEVAVTGARPTTQPEIAPVEGVQIRPASRGAQRRMTAGRRIEHVFEYIVSSYEVGAHRIAPIQIEIDGETHLTESLDFSVFNPDDLQWSKAKAGDTEFRYASTFKVLEQQPYEGQAVPVEIKLFVPRDLFVIDWGIPDFERDGLTAWRMQPTEMRSEINLLGIPYVSVAYPSTLTPTRSGEIAIGPASIRLISTQIVMDGILRRKAVESRVEVAQLKLQARQLPPNAPSGFDNAVGQFKIQVTTGQTEVREGDPIPLDILVSGSGNLDTLKAPRPVNPLGWKIYEAARQQRGDERRDLSGSVAFQQFLRPLELKSAIPAYELVFFNPRSGRYEAVSTEAIPLDMTPALGSASAPLGPPPALDTPVEQMTDILGLIPNAQLTRSGNSLLSLWWIHLSGGALAMALLLRILWLRFGHRFQRNPRRSEQLAELRALESSRGGQHEFLMAAGRYIERWLGTQSDAEVAEILRQRDERCFREARESDEPMAKDQRRAILGTLKQATHACLLAALVLCLSLGPARAEETTPEASSTPLPSQTAAEAYQAARYDRAIEGWLRAAPYEELSADTLYHIGNACYRAGSPGHAALYYRRALARESNHHEARQNLRFIERKYGMLSVERPDHQYLLARLPLGAWQAITWIGIWMLTLAWLSFAATRPGARLRWIAVMALIVAPITAVSGGLGWRYFPDDAAFAPVQRQAVIITPESILHTEASRNSAEVIEAPPGSLCEVIHQSGDWSYVSFASRTRGWILSRDIRRIVPEQAPEVPEIPKPVADETNA